MAAGSDGSGAKRHAAAARPLSGVDLRPWEGVRVVAGIGVTVLHTYMLWQFFLPHAVKHELTARNPAVRLASAGMAHVDALLVLSAALAAHQLLPELESRRRGAPSCAAVLRRYWRRRALRLLPAYAAANAVVLLGLGPAEVPAEAAAARWMHFYHCPAMLWANLLLVQNALGNRACAIHLWTVALQAQYFLALPLLLVALRPRAPGFRARLAAALAALVAGGTAWRLWAAWRAPFIELPVADFAVDRRSQQSWAHLLHAAYLPTASRVAELAVGAALGALLRSPAAVKAMRRRRRWVGGAALCLQGAYLLLVAAAHPFFRAPGAAPWPAAATRLHVALLSWGSPFVAAAAAATLAALALRADPLHATAARALGSPRWRHLAALAYPLFLVHEQARLWGILALPPGALARLVNARPLAALAAMCGGTLAAGYAAALPLHWAVERPFLPGR